MGGKGGWMERLRKTGCLFALSVFILHGAFWEVGAQEPPDTLQGLREELRRLKEENRRKIEDLEKRIRKLEERKTPPVRETAETARSAAKKAERAEEKAKAARDLAGAFRFEGYGRSGFTVNGEGGGGANNNDFASFRAPGAEADYRLGNENDTYVELGLENRWQLEDNAFFRVLFMPTFKNGNDNTFETDALVVLRQAYAEGGKFDFAPSLTYWAGQRFYRRRDIHINDFYFSTQSSYGGGVEGIPVGDRLRMAAAYLGIANDDILVEGQGQIAAQNLDLRLSEIPMPNGTLEIQVAPSYVDGGDFLDDQERWMHFDDAAGIQLGAFYDLDSFFGLTPGQGWTTLQYGSGPGIAFNPGQGVLSVTEGYHVKLEEQWKFRATLYGVSELTENLRLMPAALYQIGDNGEAGDSRITWISAGIRPVYFFNEHLGLQLEYGFDHVDHEARDYQGVLHKISLAPTLSLGKSFWARPQIRLFGTYAFWSDGFQGRGLAGEAFEDDTEGLIFGVQMEAWWGND